MLLQKIDVKLMNNSLFKNVRRGEINQNSFVLTLNSENEKKKIR